MTIKTCPVCGSLFEQKSADSHNIFYQCTGCGNKMSIAIEEGDVNNEFELAKRELLGRLHSGLVDWRVTQWEQLQKDLLDFINRYEQIHHDMQFQMAIVACLTKGFNVMEAEKYRQCKILFKSADKMYKQQLKALKAQASDPTLSETMEDHKEARAKYIRLRNQYRNTKLLWKLIFFAFKKLVPLPT